MPYVGSKMSLLDGWIKEKKSLRRRRFSEKSFEFLESGKLGNESEENNRVLERYKVFLGN